MCDGGQHFIHDQIGISVFAALVLGGDGMRAQERGHEIDRMFSSEPLDGVQHLQLGGGLQPVAGFCFGGRGAVRQHPIEPRASLIDQLVQTGRASRSHRGHDAAARVHDLHIRRARDAPLEFVGAIARKDHVRVRIDEARHHHAPAGIDDPGGLMPRGEIHGRAQINDRAVRHRQRAVGNDRQIAEAIAALRTLIVRRNRQQL